MCWFAVYNRLLIRKEPNGSACYFTSGHERNTTRVFKSFRKLIQGDCKAAVPVWASVPAARDRPFMSQRVGWLVGCLTSQQHASVSQGRFCSDNFTCCHTEIEVADQTFHLTQSQYTDTGLTSPSADPITPGA